MNYNFETIDGANDELPGISVFYKDDAGQCVPHLLDRMRAAAIS